MKQVEVAAQLEVSGLLVETLSAGGWNALKMRRRGRAFGALLITDKTPDQLKMKYAS